MFQITLSCTTVHSLDTNASINPSSGSGISRDATYYLANFSRKLHENKKVLLRERKRHTACCVASTPYVVLTAYPPPPPARVPPPAGPGRVPPLAGPGGVPSTQLPHGILGNVAKHCGIRVPPPRCELTNKVKLLPSRRTTYAGGNEEILGQKGVRPSRPLDPPMNPFHKDLGVRLHSSIVVNPQPGVYYRPLFSLERGKISMCDTHR